VSSSKSDDVIRRLQSKVKSKVNRKMYPSFRMVPFSNNLQWPLTQISRSRYYLTSNNSTMVQDRAVLTVAEWQTNCKLLYMIYRTATYLASWTTLTPDFKVTPLFDAECPSNGTICIHGFNRILIGTNTCSTQQCHCEWPWVTLSDSEIFNDTKRRAVSLR